MLGCFVSENQEDKSVDVVKYDEWLWPVVFGISVLVIGLIIFTVIVAVRTNLRRRSSYSPSASGSRTDYERSLESTYGPAPPPYDYVPTVSASVNSSDPPPGQRPSYCYDVTTRDSATLMDNELPPAYNEIINVTPQNDPRGELTDDLRDDLRGDLTDHLRDDPWVKEEESPDEVTV